MRVPNRTLNDGTGVPVIGFSTVPLRGRDCHDVILSALRNGFRLIDAASNYHNEVEIGQAVRDFLKETGTPRDEIVIQAKIPARLHEYDKAMLACSDSQQLLGLDRIDVAILHSPDPGSDAYLEAWRALIDSRSRGVVRSVGVSSCTVGQLENLISSSGVVPAVHQVELNAYLVQEEIRAHHARLGIVTQAWNPLGGGVSAYVDPPWVGIADSHHVTADQVSIRWHLQLGNVPLPMAKQGPRQQEFLDVFGFELSREEMAAILSNSQPAPTLPDGGGGVEPGL